MDLVPCAEGISDLLVNYTLGNKHSFSFFLFINIAYRVINSLLLVISKYATLAGFVYHSTPLPIYKIF